MTANLISRVRGRRQGPALRVVAIASWVFAGVGSMSDAQPFAVAGLVAIALVVAAPLLRVCWLIFRWFQEQDLRFVWTAIALLAVITMAAVVALVAR